MVRIISYLLLFGFLCWFFPSGPTYITCGFCVFLFLWSTVVDLPDSEWFVWFVCLIYSIVLILYGYEIGLFLYSASGIPRLNGDGSSSIALGLIVLMYLLYVGGRDLYQEWPQPVSHTEIVMGDSFNNIQGTIINRSSLTNSFISVNKIDPRIGDALRRAAEAIHQSGDREAGELFDQFTEELCKAEPRKSVLRSCWAAVQNALPTVTAIVEATAAVSKLFQ